MKLVERVLPSSINLVGVGCDVLTEAMPTVNVEVNYENFYLSYMPYDDVVAAYVDVVKALRRSGRRVPVIHAPYESWVAHVGAAGVEELVNAMQGLGVEVMVFHLPSRRYGELWRETASLLASLQEKYGVRIAVENLVAAPPWNDPDKLAEAARRHGLGLCMDTGHLHLNGYHVADVLRRYMNYIVALHIHDNHGVSDEHLITGAGTIDWLSVAPLLRSLLERGVWMVLEEKCLTRREGLEACKARLILQLHSILGLVAEGDGYRQLP